MQTGTMEIDDGIHDLVNDHTDNKIYHLWGT